jgi:uncharacterized protein (TIGR03083 family)
MDVDDLIAAIREQGDLMAAAAEQVSPGVTIPTCPKWRMRDLVCHQGEVHRWATAIVRDAMSTPDVPAPARPDDDELVPWFREGCTALVDVLEHADPDTACFAFLPAPSPLAFWARRQAHETGIHRVDAEQAVGTVTPFAVDLAADGIEEMLFGFASRSRSRLRSPTPRSLGVRATDAAREWIVHIGPDSVTVSRDGGDAECTVEAGASDLFMLLWNRVDPAGVRVTGGADVLDLWRDKMRISWS